MNCFADVDGKYGRRRLTQNLRGGKKHALGLVHELISGFKTKIVACIFQNKSFVEIFGRARPLCRDLASQ